jgi:hypothetical protein
MLPGWFLRGREPVQGNKHARNPVIPRNASPLLPLCKLDRALATDAAEPAEFAIGHPSTIRGSLRRAFPGIGGVTVTHGVRPSAERLSRGKP